MAGREARGRTHEAPASAIPVRPTDSKANKREIAAFAAISLLFARLPARLLVGRTRTLWRLVQDSGAARVPEVALQDVEVGGVHNGVVVEVRSQAGAARPELELQDVEVRRIDDVVLDADVAGVAAELRAHLEHAA